MVNVREINLCEVCVRAHEEPQPENLAHLVHPEDGTPGLCNTRGEAVCPACGALWIREQNRTRLASAPT